MRHVSHVEHKMDLCSLGTKSHRCAIHLTACKCTESTHWMPIVYIFAVLASFAISQLSATDGTQRQVWFFPCTKHHQKYSKHVMIPTKPRGGLDWSEYRGLTVYTLTVQVLRFWPALSGCTRKPFLGILEEHYLQSHCGSTNRNEVTPSDPTHLVTHLPSSPSGLLHQYCCPAWL